MSAGLKIHLEHNGTVLDIEREPMPTDRFRAVCGLIALLGAVHAVGVWAIVWAVVALVTVGAYKLIQSV